MSDEVEDTKEQGKEESKGVLAAHAKLVKDVYKDGASNAVKEVGELLTDLVKTARLVTAPLQIAAHLQDRLKIYFEQALKDIPIERQVTPPPTLTIVLVEKLKYQNEEDRLTLLYIELLKRACDRDRSVEAHPAFINIIPQLSEDESVLLYYLKKGGKAGKYFLSDKRGSLKRVLNHLEYTELEQPKSVKKGYTLRSSAVVNNLFPVGELLAPDYLDIYLSHLKSLNLLEIQKTPGFVSLYASPEEQLKQKLQKVELMRYKLSPFGELFSIACIPSEYDLTRQ